MNEPASPPLSPDQLLTLYQEICSSIRHYSNLRFAVLTVFFGVVGGAVALLTSDKQPPDYITLFTKLAGLGATLVFGFFEWRLAREMTHLEARATVLERQFDFVLFSHRPHLKLRTPVVTGLMYLGVFAFWVYAIFKS